MNVQLFSDNQPQLSYHYLWIAFVRLQNGGTETWQHFMFKEWHVCSLYPLSADLVTVCGCRATG